MYLFVPFSFLLIITILTIVTLYYRTQDLRSLRLELLTTTPSDRFAVSTTQSDITTLTERIYESVRKILQEEFNDLIAEFDGMKRRHSIPTSMVDDMDMDDDDEDSSAMILAVKNHVNYADEAFGARIEYYDIVAVDDGSFLRSWFGIILNSNPPENMLRSDMSPGACFAFKGRNAIVVVRLSDSIVIEAIGLEHISKDFSTMKSISSAPRYLSVYAMNATNSEIFLGNFEFENRWSSQLYPVDMKYESKNIRLHFSENHGNPDYTCIYKLAVYGRPRT